MSAYEEAWDTFRNVVDDVELDRLLKGVEREHAHELAEKIRADMVGDDPHCTTRSAKWAADLIDPEVSDGRP